MRELVADERIDVVVDRGALVDQHRIGERRRARVLHAAENEIGDEHLRVPRIRIRDAELLREQLEHLRRAGERAFRGVLAAALDVEHHRRIAPLGLDRREVADHERHEIAAVRDVELPVQRALGAGRLVGDQRTVRQREHRRRHGDLDLARRLLVRRVEAREPVARVFVLALRPHLHRLLRIAVIGSDEVQAATRRTLVVDRDHELGSCGGGRGQLDAQLLAVVPERRVLATDRDLLDHELDGIERDRLGCRRDRDRAQRRGAGHRALPRVDVEHERDVLDIDDAIRRESGTSAGERKVARHRATLAESGHFSVTSARPRRPTPSMMFAIEHA